MGDDEDAYKYFVKILLPESTSNDGETKEDDSATIADEHAARSFRAMTILKQDLSRSTFAPSVLIKNPDQAGLLAKDLLLGLSSVSASKNRYSTIHIRELLDALLEAFPEKVMGAAAAGGKQGVQDHLGPLLLSDQTLSILTHLVCYGATGRRESLRQKSRPNTPPCTNTCTTIQNPRLPWGNDVNLSKPWQISS